MSIGEGCVKTDVCLKKGKECPSKPVETPLLAAEHMCLKGLLASSYRRNKDPFKSECHEVEYWLDFMLAHPNDATETKQDIFDYVNSKLLAILETEYDSTSARNIYRAKMERLAIFMPAFKERMLYGKASPEIMQSTHQLLVEWLLDFDENHIRPIPAKNYQAKKSIEHLKTEAEIMALLTRVGHNRYFPFPSVSREEASHTRAHHNHDTYTLDEDLHKTPIQIKTSKNSRGYRGVVVIKHMEIIDALQHFLSDSDEVSRQRKRSISFTDLLQRELDKGHDPEATDELNLASMYIISRIDDFKDFRRD